MSLYVQYTVYMYAQHILYTVYSTCKDTCICIYIYAYNYLTLTHIIHILFIYTYGK